MFSAESTQQILEYFCSFPLESSTGIMEEFAKLPDATYCFDGEKRNYVYVPGTRKDRVVLAAHADTVWDFEYMLYDKAVQSLKFEQGVYRGTNSEFGIGADDRAGCAMLWLLKDSGHSLLILDGEEHGQIGANHIRLNYPELFDEINEHAYIIQFDRRGSNDYKFYNLPVSDEFREHIERKTGYVDAGRTARTDIVALCKKICGVNLSIGYYNEHTPSEYLVFAEWLHTLNIVSEFLKEEQKQYPLKNIDET